MVGLRVLNGVKVGVMLLVRVLVRVRLLVG